MLDWNWNIKNHKFEIEIEKQTDLGLFTICADIEQGMIENVIVQSDSIDLNDVDHLTKILKGSKYSKQGVEERFDMSDWESKDVFREWIISEFKLN